MNHQFARNAMELLRPHADDERYPQSLADRWFRALDQRRINAGTRTWVAQVMGIHAEGREIWVQIARGDSPDTSLVLHLSGWTTLNQAIAAIKADSREREAFPRVITAIPTV